MVNLKFELIFKDRVGIVADISALIAKQGLNIVSMEVIRQEDRARVYVETERGTRQPKKHQMLARLNSIPDILKSRVIEIMPQEERENRFRVVLDNMSDGVVSIGRDGRVTTINRMALTALDRQAHEVVGGDVRSLNLPDHTILDCLDGKTFNNVKKDLITAKGRFQYIATGRPIRDADGHVIGAVEIAKDVQEVNIRTQRARL